MEQKHHFTGLTDAEVLESRKKHGANILTPPEKDPLWKQFLEKFGDPLIIILMIAGVLSIGISFYEYLDWEKVEKSSLNRQEFLLLFCLLLVWHFILSSKLIKNLQFLIK